MDNVIYLQGEDQNKKKGIIVSVVVHLLLLLLCLFPYLTIPQPTQQMSSILVSLGTPEGGNSAIVAASTTEPEDHKVENTEKSEDTKETEDKTEKEETQKPEVKPKEVKVEKTAAPEVETLTEVSDVPIVKKPTQEEIEREAKKKEEAEAVLLKQEAQEKADEEAKRKAQAKADQEAKFNDSKKKYSDLLGSGMGSNSAPGNEGDPEGDPNAANLKGIAKGTDRIGGGLSDRGVLFEPTINDNTQKTGKVVIKICVDAKGNVSEVKFTQRGSTTTDNALVSVAEKAAWKYKFTPSSRETQCGILTVDFKLGK